METQTQTGNGQAGAAASKPKRQQIARGSTDGNIAKLTFSEAFGGKTVYLDIAKLPGYQPCTGMAAAMMVRGVLGTMQTAFANALDDPVKAAEAIVGKLITGAWSPTVGRQPGPKQHDDLVQALSEHLGISPAKVEEEYIPKYAKAKGLQDRRGGPGLSAARRMLREHSAVSTILARIASDRAKTASAKAKGAAVEDLRSL